MDDHAERKGVRVSADKWDPRQISELDHWLRMERTAQQQQKRLVAALRADGCPWSVIGEALHISKQGAYERFNPRSRRADEGGNR